MNIGKRIQYLRKEKGLTQKQLAEKSGTAIGTIRQYELNKRQPRIEHLKNIAFILDVELSDLVGNHEQFSELEENKKLSFLRKKSKCCEKYL